MVSPMKLLPPWNERVQEVEPEPVTHRIDYGLKKSPRYYAMKTNFVDSLDDAQAMLDFALQRPLSHIGFDTEFRYDRPGVVIDKRNTAYDPRSIRPLLLSLAMAEPLDDGGGCLYSFVIDLRKPELLPVLKELFRHSDLFLRSFCQGGAILSLAARTAGAEHPLGHLHLRESPASWAGTITNTNCQKWRATSSRSRPRKRQRIKRCLGFPSSQPASGMAWPIAWKRKRSGCSNRF